VAARSPEFESNGSTFDNSVFMFPSTSVASARVREFERSHFGSCANRLFEQLLMKEPVPGSNRATKVRTVDAHVQPYAIENYADDTVSYEGPLRVTLADGETMTFGLGLTAVRSARAIALYSYFIADQSAQVSLAPAVESSVHRLVDAIGTHT
jgi:hypothetical protein